MGARGSSRASEPTARGSKPAKTRVGRAIRTPHSGDFVTAESSATGHSGFAFGGGAPWPLFEPSLMPSPGGAALAPSAAGGRTWAESMVVTEPLSGPQAVSSAQAPSRPNAMRFFTGNPFSR